MRLVDFQDLLYDYQKLGWSVHQQMQDVIDGEDLEEQNPNALRMIREFLVAAAALDKELAEDLELEGILPALNDYLDEMEGVV